VTVTTPPSRPPRSWNGEGGVLTITSQYILFIGIRDLGVAKEKCALNYITITSTQYILFIFISYCLLLYHIAYFHITLFIALNYISITSTNGNSNVTTVTQDALEYECECERACERTYCRGPIHH
jgi:hypothetical protein